MDIILLCADLVPVNKAVDEGHDTAQFFAFCGHTQALLLVSRQQCWYLCYLNPIYCTASSRNMSLKFTSLIEQFERDILSANRPGPHVIEEKTRIAQS